MPADPLDLVLATRNPGKLAEIRALLRGLPVRLHALQDLEGGAPEVEEDASTLDGNARKKAETIQRHTGRPTLADDTGLEVEALGGAPGVRTARFAGEDASDAANRQHLLNTLNGETDRRAQFRTVVAYADGQETWAVEGVCRGRIIHEERGKKGFGYDAVFVPNGKDRTFAELSPSEKNAISHRSRALQEFASRLRERLEGRPTTNG